jgi:hypothetical protein
MSIFFINFNRFDPSTIFYRTESHEIQCISNYLWYWEQEDPLQLIAAALFSKPPTYIFLLLRWTIQASDHKKAYQELFGEKTFRTVVIYFAIKNNYFFICACLVIFFDFLQSDWLQQRAACYDILTVVQKSYFFAKNRGMKTILKLETLPKKFKNPPYRY